MSDVRGQLNLKNGADKSRFPRPNFIYAAPAAKQIGEYRDGEICAAVFQVRGRNLKDLKKTNEKQYLLTLLLSF